MILPISSIEHGQRTRRQMRNIDTLAASIEAVGLLHPPAVREHDGRYVLVAGARRLAALLMLGRTDTDVTVVRSLADELAALRAESDENEQREPFTPSEAVAHAERIEAVIAAEAKERQSHGATAPGRPKNACAESAQASPAPKPERTRDVVAKAVGMSHPKLAGARQVIAAAKDETLPEPVREEAVAAVAEMDRTGNVHGAVKRIETAKARHATHEMIAAEEKLNEEVYADLERSGLRRLTDPAEIAAQDAYLSMRAEAYGSVRDVLRVRDTFTPAQLSALRNDRLWQDARDRASAAVAFLVDTYDLTEAAA